MEIQEQLAEINGKLDLLNEITIKNGGGRHVTYNRNEFSQMMYDKTKLPRITENFYKYAVIGIALLQIANIFFKK